MTFISMPFPHIALRVLSCLNLDFHVCECEHTCLWQSEENPSPGTFSLRRSLLAWNFHHVTRLASHEPQGPTSSACPSPPLASQKCATTPRVGSFPSVLSFELQVHIYVARLYHLSHLSRMIHCYKKKLLKVSRRGWGAGERGLEPWFNR